MPTSSPVHRVCAHCVLTVPLTTRHPPNQLARERALRHRVLCQLALDWALDERARDLSPLFDPGIDKPELLILALAGAIKQHLGEEDVRDWLDIVMADIISTAAERVAMSMRNPDGRSRTSRLAPILQLLIT
jgi:hypothetical protein